MNIDQLKSELLLYSIAEVKPINNLLICKSIVTVYYEVLVSVNTVDQLSTVSNEIIQQANLICVVDVQKYVSGRRFTRVCMLDGTRVNWKIADIDDFGSIIQIKHQYDCDSVLKYMVHQSTTTP